jgi:hypothetical protein
MAALKPNPAPRGAKSEDVRATPLARVMREYEELVVAFETGLLRSLEYAETDNKDKDNTPELKRRRRDTLRQNACRLALAELGTRYTRKQIRRSLDAAEALGKLVEDRLHAALDAGEAAQMAGLEGLRNGYFRLYSTELFDTLGQPTDLRFGTLRFHTNNAMHSDWTSLELALNSSFFVADSTETLPYHSFHVPQAPSLQNRGILSRKADDNGAFPAYDSWLLFTFLGDGYLKVEIPIEMCADVYGGSLRGRENEEVLFWGIFVEDDSIDQ